jgi:hypothetical protein
MITIIKHEYVGKLKIPLYELLEASILIKRNLHVLNQVHNHDLERLYREKPKLGAPECISYDRHQYIIIVYPKTDKRYRLRVIGLQIVQQ